MTHSELDIFPLQTSNGDDVSVILYARYCKTYPHLANGTSIMLKTHAEHLMKHISPNFQCERLYVESDVKSIAKYMAVQNENERKIAIKAAETKNQETIELLISKTAEKVHEAAILKEENNKLLKQIEEINCDRDLLEKHLVSRIGTVELQSLRQNANKK